MTLEQKPLTARFPIGTKFYRNRPGIKTPQECTVVDILKTYNFTGDLVKIRYVATHMFCGQIVRDDDVVDTTIAHNLIA